jgi:hypothetical protein
VLYDQKTDKETTKKYLVMFIADYDCMSTISECGSGIVEQKAKQKKKKGRLLTPLSVLVSIGVYDAFSIRYRHFGSHHKRKIETNTI